MNTPQNTTQATARPSICPQCNASVIQTNLGGGKTDDYCEECGWPNENRQADIASQQPLSPYHYETAMQILHGGLFDGTGKLPTSESVAMIIQQRTASQFDALNAVAEAARILLLSEGDEFEPLQKALSTLETLRNNH